MASGTKSGKKDTGSVGDLNTTSSVSRNEKSHDVQFAEGGDNKMFGQQQAGPAKAAQTGDAGQTGKGAEFAKGGASKMFGFAGSVPARDGITSAR